MKILFEGQSFLAPMTGVKRVTYTLLQCLDENPDVKKIQVFVTVFPIGKHWKSSYEKLKQIDVSPKVAFARIPLPLGILIKCWNHLQYPTIDNLYRNFDLFVGLAHIFPPCKTTPGIFMVHDISILEHPEWYPPSAKKYQQQIIHGIRTAKQILVPSAHVKNKLIEMNWRDKNDIHVISCPLLGEYFQFKHDKKKEMRKKLFDNTNSYLCWIGDIHPRKNTVLLVQILHKLRNLGCRDLKLVLVGTLGYKSKATIELATTLGFKILYWKNHEEITSDYDILLTGYVNEEIKNTILAASDILVFPSFDEGFGYPILEAMVSGIPVVCSKRGSLPEVAGDAVELVDSVENADVYAQKIQYLLEHQERYYQLQQLGIKRNKQFSKIPGDEFLSICKNALTENR